MKIEKLNENKIRIILSNKDLLEKNINFNSFMSNSAEAQDLFLDMLEEAEERVGFVTKDYKIKIEALAMADGDFVLTITRFNQKDSSDATLGQKSKKVTAKRKVAPLDSESLVYEFNSFDDFCLFSSFVAPIKELGNIAKSTQLYTYNSKYYLLFTKLNHEHPYIRNFYTLITEFGTFINHSDLFASKLHERGKLIIKNNAIKICTKHFS